MANESQLNRRHVVAAFAATTAMTWTTPVVLGFDRLAAATGSVPASVTGAATLGTLMAGDSLRPNSVQWSSNTEFYVFEEQLLTLGAPQTTDSGMNVPAGVPVRAYLVHFSPATGNTTLQGAVDFPGTIVAYDWQDATLAARDAQWGIAGVNYGTGRRRMEWPGNDDIIFTLPSSVSLDMFAGSAFVDQIRIYVQC